MVLSLAIIITVGLIFNKLFKAIKLPGLLGMLILGIIVGPNMLDLWYHLFYPKRLYHI